MDDKGMAFFYWPAPHVRVLGISALHRNFTATSLLVYDCAGGDCVSSPRDEGWQCDNASAIRLRLERVSKPRIAGVGCNASLHAKTRQRHARAGRWHASRFRDESGRRTTHVAMR